MTFHSDESRSTETLLRQRASELLSDPENLVRKYEGLAARERRNKKQLAALEAEAEKLQANTAKLSGQTAQLTKDLGSARAALDAYRQENQRLKDDLKRVRASKSMKVGKAVLSPVHSATSLLGRTKSAQTSTEASAGKSPDQAPSDIVDTSKSASVEIATTTGRSGSVDSSESAEARGSIAVTEAVPPPANVTFALHRAFTETGAADDLAKLINHLWFVRGSVDEPLRLITEHPELCAEFDSRTAVLAKRIAGATTASAAKALIPKRSSGSAYTVERDRVMYCAHSTPVFNSNGYSTRTRGIVEGLAQAGIDVTVVARAGYPWDSAVDRAKPKKARHTAVLDGIQYVHLPGLNLNTEPLNRYILQSADALVREAKLQRPSIIHAASNFRNALPALIAARRLGLPFVYEVRGLWEVTEASKKAGWTETERYRHMAELEALVAIEADRVLAITQEVADELVGRGVPESKIRLAPNSVDANAFLPLPPDEEYAKLRQIRTDVPIVGFAGSIVEYEGLDTLLEAAKILNSEGRAFQIVIAGSGSQAEKLKRTRDEEKIQNITFTGRLPLAEMPRIYSLFDIMPCPRHSLAVTEMISPLKPLEAFAAGKAVVLSDVSPHRTLAGEGEERALLFPAGDAGALAAVLSRLFDSPDLRRDLGRRSRRWVRTHRSWVGLGERISEWHVEASRHYEEHVPSQERALSDLTIGVIADEFTSKTLSGSVNAVTLDRARWKQQLDEVELDAVFVESAWEGNGGQWRRGVGYYGKEENRDLFALISACAAKGIPTIFWNKEDPVHFNRFRLTAARCDFVFTTDADMVAPYLSTPSARTRAAASMPFYAQPRIHNPLPGRVLFDDSTSYAGTYYGDRYPDRSKTLAALLRASEPYGLTIYDRQLAVPNSSYHFPREFSPNVRGVLPYDQVLDSYKTHLAQLNVNSVVDSPSMYSRRVVEIPACGGIVISGPGRGITETFGTVIPATDDERNWRALLHSWSTDPIARVAESWLQFRSVMRSHTVDTELAIMFRTAGIPVAARPTGSYALVLDVRAENLDSVVESIAAQSVLPSAVYVGAGVETVRTHLGSSGVQVHPVEDIPSTECTWMGVIDSPVGRTHFEDLLFAERFGDWDRIAVRQAGEADRGATIARVVKRAPTYRGLARTSTLNLKTELKAQLSKTVGEIVEWIVVHPTLEMDTSTVPAASERPGPLRVVVAGHDLKFAGPLIEDLKRAGHSVVTDDWQSHTAHDEEHSRALLESADVIFCEWGLGNAVWYSKHKLPNQRLIVRVHSQELRGPHLRAITSINVNSFVFVSELIRQAAVTSHGIPASKSVVIPNFVDTVGLNRPKLPGAEKSLGLVGIVPQMKRLDLALDIVEELLSRDPEYRLIVKGKGPDDYPWMKHRPEELAFYDEQYARVAGINADFPDAVTFEGFSSDMAGWYSKIGIALSVSDFESFHLTIPDGAASGAEPYCLAWPGADLIYPDEWIFDSTAEIAEGILAHASRAEAKNRSWVTANFDSAIVAERLRQTIVGAGQ